jgi:mRNA export factor
MFSQATVQAQKDIEVTGGPDDTISSLKFSPGTSMAKNFLLAGSWDCSVRCWEVSDTGSTIPKAMKTMTGPVLDVNWHDDGTKAFVAGADKTARMWDLAADTVMQVAAHDNAVKTCHWVKAPNYCCLMTGELDKKVLGHVFN